VCQECASGLAQLADCVLPGADALVAFWGVVDELIFERDAVAELIGVAGVVTNFEQLRS
jgi:hypothetical protein